MPRCQISVLESYMVSTTPRSDNHESQMKIFQAFDQYVEDNDNTHLMQEETKLQVLKQLLKNPKGISGSAVINDF